MGRSAKFHKRPKKPTASSSTAPSLAHTPPAKPSNASAGPYPQEQKKRAGLKAKAASARRRKDGAEGPVLGGADYVDLMLGGRRRAMEEAAKLPMDN